MLHQKVQTLVEHRYFQQFILTLIIINAVILGLETSPVIHAAYSDSLLMLDSVILGIFVIEIALRIYVYRKEFFRNPWSMFDLTVVAIAFLPHAAEFSVLRTFRVLRVLRLISAVPAMRRVVTALISSLSGIAAVAMIMLVIFYVFSVIATTLFRDISPEFFGSLGHTMLTLFQVMTLEDWADIARPVMKELPFAWLFFVSYIMVSTFVILNLFIGVMVNALEHCDEINKKKAPNKTLLAQQAILAELQALREEVRELKGKQ